MMHAALTFLVAFPALAAARNVVTIGMTGGWHEANVTAVNTQLLADALSGSSFSKAVGDTRVCYSEVASVETQVVAGTNYRFHIDGCSVTDSDGECSDATLAACKPSEFEVKIFEQPWTSTLKVTGIKEVEQAASSAASESGSGSAGEEQKALQTTQTSEESVAELKAAGLSEDEKEAVDEWIGTNGLNQYGDEATRIRHSDRPWQETANFFAAEVDETQGGGTVAGVLAMLGVFTVVLAAVAVLKMHQGRRERFRYNPIHSREQ
ncbi:hypothetical protein KRP22_001281 [Phytophthora ramorum]|nr:Cystatin-like cysteine protease inhibitor EPIC4 [Phytophthora ramorum]